MDERGSLCSELKLSDFYFSPRFVPVLDLLHSFFLLITSSREPCAAAQVSDLHLLLRGGAAL